MEMMVRLFASQKHGAILHSPLNLIDLFGGATTDYAPRGNIYFTVDRSIDRSYLGQFPLAQATDPSIVL